MKHEIDNFTVVLPVTCNADCSFCPEKEMENKASKQDWLDNMVLAVNETASDGYDHISVSGGEPTLDLRLLTEAVYAILNGTHIKKVGITTNAQFLESRAKAQNMIQFINSGILPVIDFMNISRHAVRTSDNNKIMGVNYKHTLSDIIRFRNAVNVRSFHINVVVTAETDLDELFREYSLVQPVLDSNNIDIVFRTDYTWQNTAIEDGRKIVEILVQKFTDVFGEYTTVSECGSCLTLVSSAHPNVYLKGAAYEPTLVEDVAREFVFHQDGALYYDWERNLPVQGELARRAELKELLGESTLQFDAAVLRQHSERIPVQNTFVPEVGATGPCGFGTCSPACGYSTPTPAPVKPEEYRGCSFSYTRCGF